MGVFGADLPKAALRVVFRALIAGYNPRGQAGGAHDDGETLCVVFAETLSGGEHKLVDAVASGSRRRAQGVAEMPAGEVVEDVADERAFGRRLLGQCFGEAARLRVAFGQARVTAVFGFVERVRQGVAQCGL